MSKLKNALVHNTRFIQFGQTYKAFAKAVAPRKTIIFALQMSNKHSIIVSNIFGRQSFKPQTEINRENVSGKAATRKQKPIKSVQRRQT
jgi:hypothetical protein